MSEYATVEQVNDVIKRSNEANHEMLREVAGKTSEGLTLMGEFARVNQDTIDQLNIAVVTLVAAVTELQTRSGQPSETVVRLDGIDALTQATTDGFAALAGATLTPKVREFVRDKKAAITKVVEKIDG